MLRNLVLLTFLALAVPTMAVEYQPTGKQDARKSQRDAKQADVPTAPITNNQATSYYEQTRENKPQGWHKFVAWPEGITAWAIMLTLGAIIWQAWETRKAAQATQVSSQATLRSIKLQEVQLRQRVEIGEWEATTPYIQPTADKATLTISFSVFNPTEMVLTLETIDVTAGPIWETGRGCISHEMRYVLAPDSGFPVSVQVPMKGEVFARYNRGEFEVVVTIDVVFDDAFNVSQSQKLVFSGNCRSINRGDFTLQQSTHSVQEEAT